MDIPKSDTWLTTEEVAELLGCSKQNIHKMLARGYFHSAVYVGSIRPVYLISIKDAEKVEMERYMAAS